MSAREFSSTRRRAGGAPEAVGNRYRIVSQARSIISPGGDVPAGARGRGCARRGQQIWAATARSARSHVALPTPCLPVRSPTARQTPSSLARLPSHMTYTLLPTEFQRNSNGIPTDSIEWPGAWRVRGSRRPPRHTTPYAPASSFHAVVTGARPPPRLPNERLLRSMAGGA